MYIHTHYRVVAHVYMFTCRTENFRLLGVHHHKSKKNAKVISSIFVKDLKSGNIFYNKITVLANVCRLWVGFPEFFLSLYSDEAIDQLTDALNATGATFGTDMGIVFKFGCSHQLVPLYEMVPLESIKAFGFNKTCAYDR